jgi:hypothetical protein
MINLGSKYRDKITGFEGIATGFCQYISGCHQALICPPVAADGAKRDSNWFDVQRLEQLEAEPITLCNGQTPGCDLPAPKR